MVMLSHQREIRDVSGAIKNLIATAKGFHESASTQAIGDLCVPYASYFDACVKGLWESTSDYGGIIPCRSLWDVSGNRLAAVLLFRT
jgi:hypothetical protein